MSRDEVLAVAALARLRLDDDEAARLGRELSRILEHMEALAAAAIGEAPAFDIAAGGAAPLREDDPAPEPLAVPPAAFAPGWVEAFFAVPRLPAVDAGQADAPAAS